jgi:hypothetical protein
MLAPALPDLDRRDIEALRALVVEQHAQCRQAYSAHLEALFAQNHEIQRLRLIIEELKRMMFGPRVRWFPSNLNNSNCAWRVGDCAGRR